MMLSQRGGIGRAQTQGCGCHSGSGCGSHGGGRGRQQDAVADRSSLESYQRDLEQELADVLDR
ncbi:MAG: hypothetical protein ACYDEA_11595, partial [Candidatus Dormibacteria bacterium]